MQFRRSFNTINTLPVDRTAHHPKGGHPPVLLQAQALVGQPHGFREHLLWEGVPTGDAVDPFLTELLVMNWLGQHPKEDGLLRH